MLSSLALSNIDKLLTSYQSGSGVRPGKNHVMVCGIAMAHHLMKEILNGRDMPEITMTLDEDELFCFRGIPVRLRVKCETKKLALYWAWDIEPANCCDKAAMRTLMVCASRGAQT